MKKINREDMLELTRRMTPSRSCFTRLAGAYLDEEGFEEGSFNIHFLKLTPAERERNLKLAKAIPFSETNVQLKLFPVSSDPSGKGQVIRLLQGLNGCGLKNDALLSMLYEVIGETFSQADMPYAVYLFHGSYDVPLRSSDKAEQWESEEVYDFLILCLCPLVGDYEPGQPRWGLLYPAFTDRSSDPDHIAIFEEDPDRPHVQLTNWVLGNGVVREA